MVRQRRSGLAGPRGETAPASEKESIALTPSA